MRRPSLPATLGAALVLVASAVLTAGTAGPALAQGVTALQQQLSQTAAERAAAQRELAEVRRRTTSARDRYNVVLVEANLPFRPLSGESSDASSND